MELRQFLSKLICGIMSTWVYSNTLFSTLLKATFPPNISIKKFCQSTKRIIGVSSAGSAAVVRDVFATTASFKWCTVLHNAFPVFTTVYVFQANSMRTLVLAPSRPLQNTSTHHAVSSWLLDPGRYAVHTKAYYNGRIWKWISQDPFCTEDRPRIAPGGPPFLRSIIVEMFGGNVALKWHKHPFLDPGAQLST